MDTPGAKNVNNAMVPYNAPTLPVTLAKVARRKAPKIERKDKTMWDNALTKLFLHHRLLLRDAYFKGKSAPNYALGKVLDKMKKEDPELVRERHITVLTLLNK